MRSLSRRLERAVVRAVNHLFAVDVSRVATAVVAGGALVALAAVALGGYVPVSPGGLTDLVYLFAIALPLIGGGIALAGLWLLDFGAGARASTFVDQPPEAGRTDATGRVGEGADRQIRVAANAHYACRRREPVADVRERLAEAATRAVRTSHGLDAAAAEDAVREGTWTDDPVAAALLGDPPLPLSERLRTLVDPGAAYRRRVRRTLDAIEAVDAATVADRFDGDRLDGDSLATDAADAGPLDTDPLDHGSPDGDGGVATGATHDEEVER